MTMISMWLLIETNEKYVSIVAIYIEFSLVAYIHMGKVLIRSDMSCVELPLILKAEISGSRCVRVVRFRLRIESLEEG